MILIQFFEVKKIVLIAMVLIFHGGIALKSQNKEISESQLGRLLPTEIIGWKTEGEDKTYDPETIFDYIDGAGEVYRSYNFQRLYVRRYSKSTKPELVADLFEMSSSKDAFGVFTHDLEGEDAQIGQGSTYKGGLLSFWKDRFFVSLYAEEETKETREALFALGRDVASSIKREGERPKIVSMFPEKTLDRKSIRYFHNHMILNYHYFVADENILFLDQKTEAAIAIYKNESEKIHLLLVRYPGVKRTSEAFQNFLNIYMPDALKTGLVRTEDLKWTLVKVKNEFIIIVFNAPSETYAKELAGNVEKMI